MVHLKRNANIILFFLLVTGIFIQCKKLEVYPIEPKIKFESFIRFDTITQTSNGETYLFFQRGVIQFSFTDGDGDLGVDIDPNDTVNTFPRDFANLFITYYEIQNKDTVLVPLITIMDDTMTFNSVIPSLTPEDSEGNGIKGEINDTLFLQNDSSYDTILFEILVKDRAEHSSNSIWTPYIIRRIKI